MLDIYGIYDLDNGSKLGYYAKGRHTLEDMVQAIDMEEGNRTWPIYTCLVVYLRVVPCKGDYGSSMLIHSSKGRGAFEATVVYKELEDI